MRYPAFILAAAMAVAAAPLSAETLLVPVNPGGVVTVDLDREVPPTRVRVLIDGDEVIAPVRVVGDQVTVPIPADLGPGRHDLRVEEAGIDGGFSETFLFDVPGGALGGAAILSFEAGVRGSEDRTEPFATGSLGVDLNSADRRTRLAFRLSRPQERADGDVYELNSYVFETTRTAFGADVTLQIGDHNLTDDDLLSDGAVRRGISLTAEDAARTRALTAFALAATGPDGWINATGLEETGDRLLGVAGNARLAAGRTELRVLAYDGRAPLLPSGEGGDTRMVGLGLSQLAFDDRAVFDIDVARSEWGDAREADAVRVGVDVGLLQRDDPRTFALGIEARRIETDFYSALNPGLISGEEGVTLSVEYISPFWTANAEIDRAETNVAGPSDAATDRLTRLEFDVRYDPNDFTGTWLNGTTFFVAGEMRETERTRTPDGAPPPSDNVYRRLTFGADRFLPGLAWSLGYTVEEIDDRSGGEDEWAQYLDAIYSRDLANGALGLSLTLGDVSTPEGRFGEVDAAISYRHVFDNPLWEALLEAGIADFENPALDDGRFVRAELSRQVAETAWMVVEADYGEGDASPRLADGDGWQVGFYLRADLDLTRSRF